MALIEIGRRNYLLYLVLPHLVKMALLSDASRAKLDAINRLSNETIFSGDGAVNYDLNHRYGEAEQHDHPCRRLIEELWAPEGYGRALDLGAGSGYFTTMIARRAKSVTAVELVPDMQRMLRERCASEGTLNVEVIGAAASDLRKHVADASIDSALVLQSLHHFHRREEVFAALGAAVRPGGRLFLVEPHHNARRAVRLLRGYLGTYRAPAYWSDERNWATHDFLTRREIHALCRRGGFEDVRISGFWIPFARRVLPDPRRRFRVERVLGSVPVVRHLAGVLAVEARRKARAVN
jgi:SAM-dependent methyltransferase